MDLAVCRQAGRQEGLSPSDRQYGQDEVGEDSQCETLDVRLASVSSRASETRR